MCVTLYLFVFINDIISGFNHVAACTCGSFIVIVQGCCPADGHLNCFQPLTLTTKAVKDIHIYIHPIYCCLVPDLCPTLCDPMDCVACQAPLSLGYWSGLPFPSTVVQKFFWDTCGVGGGFVGFQVICVFSCL